MQFGVTSSRFCIQVGAGAVLADGVSAHPAHPTLTHRQPFPYQGPAVLPRCLAWISGAISKAPICSQLAVRAARSFLVILAPMFLRCCLFSAVLRPSGFCQSNPALLSLPRQRSLLQGQRPTSMMCWKWVKTLATAGRELAVLTILTTTF